jgi:hypothetical protein
LQETSNLQVDASWEFLIQQLLANWDM